MTTNDEQLNNEQIVDELADEQPEQAPEAAAVKKRGKTETIINVALWVAIVVLLVSVVLRLFVFNTVAVSGASMNPTYEDGNVVTVNKAATPKRGDVVVFYTHEVDNKFTAQFASPEQCQQGGPFEKYVKRVVATAGDKIWAQRIANNGADVLYEVVIDTADGDRLFENYYVKKGETLAAETYYIHSLALTDLGILQGCTEKKPFVVSEGCFFAMGDNRSNSKDSRELGEFKVSQVFGVVLDK